MNGLTICLCNSEASKPARSDTSPAVGLFVVFLQPKRLEPADQDETYDVDNIAGRHIPAGR